jgi:hypothetical protein
MVSNPLPIHQLKENCQVRSSAPVNTRGKAKTNEASRESLALALVYMYSIPNMRAMYEQLFQIRERVCSRNGAQLRARHKRGSVDQQILRQKRPDHLLETS